MKINVKFTDMEHDDALREYALAKIGSFAKLIDDSFLEDAVCEIEFKKDTHHQTGNVCSAEVTLEVNGKLYRSTKAEKRHEKAIDKVKDDILQELRVRKQKRQHKFLKGAKKLKEMVRSAGQ